MLSFLILFDLFDWEINKWFSKTDLNTEITIGTWKCSICGLKKYRMFKGVLFLP